MIAVVEAPTRRTTGRKPRLSDEDFQDLANAVKEGLWASDNETVKSESAAYQRAQSVVKVLGERFKLTSVATNVTPVDPQALETARQEARSTTTDAKKVAKLVAEKYTSGYFWRVGPKAETPTQTQTRSRKRTTPSQ